jgi:hypothetical protein
MQVLRWEDPAGAFRLIFWLTTIPGDFAVLSILILVKNLEQTPNSSLKFFTALLELPSPF